MRFLLYFMRRDHLFRSLPAYYHMAYLRSIFAKAKHISTSLRMLHTFGHQKCQVKSDVEEKIYKRLNLKPLKMKRTAGKRPSPGPVIDIHEHMTLRRLSAKMGRSLKTVYDALEYVPGGELYDTDDTVFDDLQVVIQVLQRCGFRYKIVSLDTLPKKIKIADALRRLPNDNTQLLSRSPVITIMGHVDHGKTTLLDSLRSSRVVDSEFGGITQHIGAFSVKLNSGENVTFIDTPGHAAFSTMRARGATVTDIIVLVIAADDGVMLQTIESLEHAKAANVPVIVAINKIDRPSADIQAAKDSLMEVGVAVEELGGDIQAVPISALKGIGLNELLDAILTQAEILDLKADISGPVEGVVIETRTHPAQGKTATAIIQRGTLTKGSFLVAGTAYGKVRALYSDTNAAITEAGPSTPVEIFGWKELPSPGDVIIQVASEARMKEVVKLRQSNASNRKAEEDLAIIEAKREEHKTTHTTNMLHKRSLGFRYHRGLSRGKESVVAHTGPLLSVIVKGDVDGTLEAIMDVIDTYDSSKCDLDIVSFGIGNITAADIDLAQSFSAVIYGFNVTSPANIHKLAEEKNVQISIHRVIYSLFDDLKSRLTSQLPPAVVEDIIGEATVQEIYKITERKAKVTVAGCRCTSGVISKKQLFRVIRNGQTVHEGKLKSLHHFKNEVDTIKTDIECGIRFEDKSVEFEKGDTILCYSLRSVDETIDWNLNF